MWILFAIAIEWLWVGSAYMYVAQCPKSRTWSSPMMSCHQI